MVLFIGSKWFCLQDKILSVFRSVLTIIISPTVHFRNFSGPVSMTRTYWRCPFQCIGLPWILRSYFSSFEYGIEKIEYKHNLHRKYNHGHSRNKPVQFHELIEG